MRNIIIKCPTCGGGNQIETSPNHYKCPYCGNEWASQSSNEQKTDILNVIMSANASREALDFEKAEKMYQQIIAQYPDEDLSDAYWGLFLCEQRCLFEYSQDSKTQFPSFFDIVKSKKISESVNLKNARLQALRSGNSNKEQIYSDLAKRMMTSKNKYFEIKKAIAPYDIFICFRNTPKLNKLARDLYYDLKGDGYHVFFSEETLKYESKGEWEPNIYYGLYSAKVMLVLCADNEELESQWVKNEWSRYKQMATANSQKDIIPILIGDYTADDLPTALKSYQGIIEDYKLFATLKARLQKMIRPMDQEEHMKNIMAEQIKQQLASQNQAIEGSINVNTKRTLSIAEKFFKQRQYDLAQPQYALCLSNNINDYYAQFMCIACKNASTRNYNSNDFEKSLCDTINSLILDKDHIYGDLLNLFDNLRIAFGSVKTYGSPYSSLFGAATRYIINLVYINPSENNDALLDPFKEQFTKLLSTELEKDALEERGIEYVNSLLNYCKGQSLIKKGEYFDAYMIFRDEDLFDSKDLHELCEKNSREDHYNYAKTLLENHKLENAEREWALLADVHYKDSDQYVLKVQEAFRQDDYDAAVKLKTDGQYKEALEAFRTIRKGTNHYPASGNGFLDSLQFEKELETHFMEKDYQAATAEVEKKNYNKAREIFEKLVKGTGLYVPSKGGYKDSKAQAAKMQRKENRHATFKGYFPSNGYVILLVGVLLMSLVLVILGLFPNFIVGKIGFIVEIIITSVGCAGLVLTSALMIFRYFCSSDKRPLATVIMTSIVGIAALIWFAISPLVLGVKISDVKDLQLLGKYPGGNYYLADDIDCGGQNLHLQLKGTLDGKGHKISNIKCILTGGSDAFPKDSGLISIEGSATIKNVTFDNIEITSDHYCPGGYLFFYQEYGRVYLNNLKFYNINIPYNVFVHNHRDSYFKANYPVVLFSRYDDYCTVSNIYIDEATCGGLQALYEGL